MGIWIANNFEAESLEILAMKIGEYHWESETPGDVTVDSAAYINGCETEAPKSTVIALEKDAQGWAEYFTQSEKENKSYERECATRIYDRF